MGRHVAGETTILGLSLSQRFGGTSEAMAKLFNGSILVRLPKALKGEHRHGGRRIFILRDTTISIGTIFLATGKAPHTVGPLMSMEPIEPI